MQMSSIHAPGSPKFMPKCRHNTPTFQQGDVFGKRHVGSKIQVPLSRVHERLFHFSEIAVQLIRIDGCLTLL